MFAHSQGYNYICGKLSFYGVFCIIGYVFIYYVKQCFADIVAQVPMQYATLKLR